MGKTTEMFILGVVFVLCLKILYMRIKRKSNDKTIFQKISGTEKLPILHISFSNKSISLTFLALRNEFEQNLKTRLTEIFDSYIRQKEGKLVILLLIKLGCKKKKKKKRERCLRI